MEMYVGKATSLSCRGGLKGCEILRIPQRQDDRLTGGGEVISLTRRPRSTPQQHFVSVSDIHLCQRLSKFQSLVQP
jgi:hypothetical protein